MPTRSDRRPGITRRTFLSAAALAACPFWRTPSAGAAVRRLVLADDPFQLGVASGDPTPTGVVLWTRLAPDPLHGGGMPPEPVEVSWEVADDEGLRNVVRKGTATASPDLAHSVHVEVEGLEPDRWYWYRFRTADAESPLGRTRTAPADDALPAAVRFAFASCQHYESGLYTAYEHMAGEPLDLVIHLGDYIYEGAPQRGQVRRHVGDGELHTLEDYRNRHAQYKTDPHLQGAHAACPWLVTWDDHEFDNNYAGAISEQRNVDPQEFLVRRAAAYQACYEHMPLRKPARPHGPDMRLYRGVPFGRLVDFAVLDTRQYRTDQPCGDGNKPPCAGVFDPAATLLGQEQEQWLFERLQASPARWNVLAQQVMMARVDRLPGPLVAWSMDQWGGYDVARKRLLEFVRDRRVSNPVVLTGDIHTNWVNDLKVDFDAPESPTVATEFVGTSISSGGNGSQTRADTSGVLADNPFVKFYNAERGYVSCQITPERWTSQYQVVEDVRTAGAPRVTRASFVVEHGRPGAERHS
ncbi:MAG TPA: alkaline phosphatase D family protein [Planctomycetaceae bacterium]|nr:alkaline phosphatase D family protein [Planctomycetaceae bacterium]